MYKTALAIASLFLIIPLVTLAQQTQIPTLQVCNDTSVELAQAYMETNHRGYFHLSGKVSCKDGHPVGTYLFIDDIELKDSRIRRLETTYIEQITGLGSMPPDGSYTAILSGRCIAITIEGNEVGCKIWMLLNDADQLGIDLISFVVFAGDGDVISYGTGMRKDGVFEVTYTP